MDSLITDKTLSAKRRSEWDNLFAHLSTYRDSTDISFGEIGKIYGKKQNVHVTSVKHGFRKRFANRKRQTRPQKLAFEVLNLNDDRPVTEELSDGSTIYSENDKLQSDISDSESVDSVQYILQCNEQRKLPDFNAKVENCQTYLSQNACFIQGVREYNANVHINNSSILKKSFDNDTSKVNNICEDTLLCFLEQNSTDYSVIKSTLYNTDIDDYVINPFEDEQILTNDKSQISSSEKNKQFKSVLHTEIFPKINKKLTLSSVRESEIGIQRDNGVSDSSTERNNNKTDNFKSQNSIVSTTQNTKTFATNKTDLNSEIHLNQSKLRNIESVNNSEHISTIKLNEKPKIYSSAARKMRQLSCNTDTESSASERSVDKTSNIRNIKSNTKKQMDNICSIGMHINNGQVTERIENKSHIEIKRSNEQNTELRTDVKINTIHNTPSKHKQTPTNICPIMFSTEIDSIDTETSIFHSNLNEMCINKEDIFKILPKYVFSTETDTEEYCTMRNQDKNGLKSNSVVKSDNKTDTVLKENSQIITNNESKTAYKQTDSTKSNSSLKTDQTKPVKTRKSVSKLQNVTPKNSSKLFDSTSLIKEKSAENSEEEYKENRLPKENTTTKKSKDTEKRKTSKKTETNCSASELNVILKSKSNVPAKNTRTNKFNKNNFIKNQRQDVTTDNAEMQKQYLISSTPYIKALRNKSRKEQSLKENNKDDTITGLFACDQSTIINEEHMNDVTQINIEKIADKNSPEQEKNKDILGIFETTIGNNSKRKNGQYTNNILTENTLINGNCEDNETTLSDTIINKEDKNYAKRGHNKNGLKIITNSRNNEIIDTSDEIENKERTLTRSSRKKKSRENIHKSPGKSNSDNESSKIIKCRQRLFNACSEYDEENVENCTIKFAVLNSLKTKCKQDDELHVNKDKSKDLYKDNETHLLTQTTDIISNGNQNKHVSFGVENHKKRKLRDNCGPVKQTEKKHKTINNNTNKNSTERVTLNGTLENCLKNTVHQKSNLETIENNIKHEEESSINDNNAINMTLQTSQENVSKHKLLHEVNTTNSQLVNSINNKCSVKVEKCNLSGKENVEKRGRRKSRKEIRFIEYSTDDTDKSWLIRQKNLTPLSLEYFLNDDVF